MGDKPSPALAIDEGRKSHDLRPFCIDFIFGGSAWESNPPTPMLSGHIGFEDREAHRGPSTPASNCH